MTGTASASLVRALAIGDGSLLALVGAGGKTTTMLAIGGELSAAHAVVLTTTTRIWPVDGVDTVLAGLPGDARQSLRGAGTPSLSVLAGSRGPDGKLHGVSPDVFSPLAGDRIVICEADGAAGRPLKVHGSGEPVVPATSTHLLVIAGLDAVGTAAAEGTVHRLGRYSAVTGGMAGEPILPVHVARAVRAAAAFAPSAAKVYVLLNKADLVAGGVTEGVAAEIHRLMAGTRVYATSRGALVQDLS